MKNEKVYEFLNRARWTKARIRNKMEQRSDLALMMLPAGIRYDRDSVQTSPSDQMIEYACKIDELDREIEALRLLYLQQQEETVGAIEQLEDMVEQSVLIARYIRGERFEDIPEICSISIASVYRAHRRGLDHLVDIVDKIVEKVPDGKLDSE